MSKCYCCGMISGHSINCPLRAALQRVKELDAQLASLQAELEEVKARIPDDIQDMSDGYHTFRELYDHRCLLWINTCLMCHSLAFWRPHYPGWPLLGLEIPDVGQITYHVPEKFVTLFQGKIKQGGPEWDGHTSADVLIRLTNLAIGLAVMENAQEGGK